MTMEIDERQIVYNSAKCLECNQTIVSRHVHDYSYCGCANHAFIDGGTYYVRYGAINMDLIEINTVYADDDFELVRKLTARGSRGIDGKQPLTWIPIAEMDKDYIEAVLEYGGAEWHLNLLRKELKYREDNGIKH